MSELLDGSSFGIVLGKMMLSIYMMKSNCSYSSQSASKEEVRGT